MSPQRITKKEIKKDKFVTFTFKLSEWVQKHLNHVLMGGGGVVLIVLIVFFVLSSQSKRERKAAESLGKASLELQSGDLRAAVGDLQIVVNQYGGTKSAGQADFLLASAYFYAKDYAQAQSFFERYLGKFNQDPLVAAAAQAGIAECHVQRGNFALAGEAFVKAVSMNPQGLLSSQYLLEAADAYLKAKQTDKAKDILNRLIKEYPASREVSRAQMLLTQSLSQ
ncbi:MAG: outer membrane protein assembly factor BamD [Candidatus Zixiibacteriota bacterium]